MKRSLKADLSLEMAGERDSKDNDNALRNEASAAAAPPAADCSRHYTAFCFKNQWVAFFYATFGNIIKIEMQYQRRS